MNLWSIQPDWANGVTENLAWLTDVLQGQSGAEQRRQMRLSPRRTLEYDFWCAGPARTLFDLMVTAGGSDEWLLPLWFDGDRLSGSFNAGSPAVGIDTTNTEFFAGSQVVLYADEFTYEVKTIQSVSAVSLQFSEVTSMNWPKGTRVMPVRPARLTDQPSISKLTSQVAQGTVRLQMTQNNDFTPSITGDLYGLYVVVGPGPNERDSIDVTWTRLLLSLDDTVSIVQQVDTANIGFYKQKHPVMLRGKAEHNAFRGMLYALAGRMTPVWLPTFAEDFKLLSATNGSTLTVRNTGYSQFRTALTGKKDIQILCTDGTRLYTSITGAQLVDSNTERLQITVAQFGRTLTPANVRRISLMTLSRSDIDAVDITHQTDSTGVSESVLAFISSPEIRNVV